MGKVLPAVLAPLIILELHADQSWVGIYLGLTASRRSSANSARVRTRRMLLIIFRRVLHGHALRLVVIDP